MTMRFEGGRELEAALSSLSTRISRKIVTEALHDAAAPMQEASSRLAPHAPGQPDLRDNIVIKTGRSGENSAGTFGGPVVNMGPSKGFFYGYFQEFGTAHHGAHAFMRPAFDQAVPKALDILRRTMWMELTARGFGVTSRTSTVPAQSGPGSSAL